MYVQLSNPSISNPKIINKLKSNTNIILALKRQVKDLKDELYEKENQIQQIVQSIKHTKNQEYEIHIKILNDECIRLKKIIDANYQYRETGMGQDIVKLEEKMFEQKKLIMQIQHQNLDLSNKNKIKDEQIISIKKELDSEIQKSRRSNENITEIKARRFEEIENELRIAKESINHLNEEAREKELLVEKINKENQEIQNECKKIQEDQKKEIIEMNALNRKKLEEYEEKINCLEKMNSSLSVKIKEETIKHNLNKTMLTGKELDIERKLLIMNLQSNNVEEEKSMEIFMKFEGNFIDKSLFFKILSDFPFELEDPTKIIQFIMSQILKNEQYNENQIEKNELIKCLKQFIGKYTLITEEHQKAYKTKIRLVFV